MAHMADIASGLLKAIDWSLNAFFLNGIPEKSNLIAIPFVNATAPNVARSARLSGPPHLLTHASEPVKAPMRRRPRTDTQGTDPMRRLDGMRSIGRRDCRDGVRRRRGRGSFR